MLTLKSVFIHMRKAIEKVRLKIFLFANFASSDENQDFCLPLYIRFVFSVNRTVYLITQITVHCTQLGQYLYCHSTFQVVIDIESALPHNVERIFQLR